MRDPVVNLFTDIFSDTQGVGGTSMIFPLSGRRVGISMWEKINFVTKLILIFSIVYFVYTFKDDNINLGDTIIKKSDRIVIQDIYINDPQAGDKFIKYLQENGKDRIEIEDLTIYTLRPDHLRLQMKRTRITDDDDN